MVYHGRRPACENSHTGIFQYGCQGLGFGITAAVSFSGEGRSSVKASTDAHDIFTLSIEPSGNSLPNMLESTFFLVPRGFNLRHAQSVRLRPLVSELPM